MDTIIKLVESEYFRNLILIAALLVAIISVLANRSTARLKQTADLLFDSRNDKDLQEGHKIIRSYHDAPDKKINVLGEPDKFENEDAIAIRYVLNHFEVVAIGIKRGIYDETVVKEAWCRLLVTCYERTEPLIKAIRDKSKIPTALQEFECLACRWKDKPLKKRKLKRNH